MTIGNAIVNQALGAANRQAMGGLKKVMGNLPGSSLSGGKAVSGLPQPSGGSMNLSYPLDVELSDQQGHYVMFMINTSDPAIIEKQKKAAEDAAMDALFGGQPEQQLGGVDPRTFNGGRPAIANAPKGALSIKRPATTRLAKAISLYMPPNVRATYNTAYADETIGAGAELSAEVIQSMISTYNNEGWKGFIPSLDKLKKAGSAASGPLTSLGLQLAKTTSNTFAPILGMGGAFGLAEISQGKILSSKMELLFTGVGRRKFSFTFTFIPKSEKESKMVDEIIYTFKRHMIPDVANLISSGGATEDGGQAAPEIDLNSQGRILTIPDTFDISYMYSSKENPWMNKISTCYLENLDVQYGGDRMSFYEPLQHEKGGVGPPPQSTTITLAFSEIEKMLRTRIEQGY